MEDVKKVNLSVNELQEIAIYNNGQLALIDKIDEIDMEKIIQMDVYSFGLAMQGEASININGARYTIRKDCLLINQPRNMLDSRTLSTDFRALGIGMSPEYLQRIFPEFGSIRELKRTFAENPLCALRPDEAKVFRQYYDLLCSKIHLPSPVQESIIDALMQAFLYDMLYLLRRVIRMETKPLTASERLLDRFIEMLETSYPKNRSVAHYADRLCVTPKYLSAACKEASKETASSLINRYMAKDIEYLMKYTKKTVKEIAYELDFPDLSFFGRYVKKHLGKRPRELQESFRQTYRTEP